MQAAMLFFSQKTSLNSKVGELSALRLVSRNQKALPVLCGHRGTWLTRPVFGSGAYVSGQGPGDKGEKF